METITIDWHSNETFGFKLLLGLRYLRTKYPYLEYPQNLFPTTVILINSSQQILFLQWIRSKPSGGLQTLFVVVRRLGYEDSSAGFGQIEMRSKVDTQYCSILLHTIYSSRWSVISQHRIFQFTFGHVTHEKIPEFRGVYVSVTIQCLLKYRPIFESRFRFQSVITRKKGSYRLRYEILSSLNYEHKIEVALLTFRFFYFDTLVRASSVFETGTYKHLLLFQSFLQIILEEFKSVQFTAHTMLAKYPSLRWRIEEYPRANANVTISTTWQWILWWIFYFILFYL